MSDNVERFARETRIVRSYGAYANGYILISALAILLTVVLRPEALGWLPGVAFLASIVFATLYQYFGTRYLVNLGTRYDLMPIVKRSLKFSAGANRPIIFYVCGMLAFYLGWLSLIWKNL